MDKVTSPNSTPRKLKFEQLRADYELFLQTFEKPTWIYRLLQRRQQISPFMLHRNLAYLRDSDRKMKERQQSKRLKFKVDDLLGKVSECEEMKKEEDSDKSHYMNLSFGGFFHGPGFAEDIFLTNDPKVQEIFKDDFVNVDIHLVHVYHKRKKDKHPPLDVIPLGECQAPWNPRTQLLLPCSSVQLSVPPTAFADNGRSIKTHIIAITVSILVPKKSKKKKGRKKKVDGSPESDSASAEPPIKRVKIENSENLSEDSLQELPIEKITATFSAELIVYDKHKNCLLTNGDYELLLQENVEPSEQGRNSSWENKFKNKLGPFAAFSFGPTIKFNLTWDSKPKVPVKSIYKSLSDPYIATSQPLTNGSICNNYKEEVTSDGGDKDPLLRVFYQFIYNNSTRQQTEAREGTSCPWCAVKTRRLYGLLKHLKCCHSRFAFLYTSLKNGHRIDVCVNDNFESSLSCDGIKDIGFIRVENAPLKRVCCTEVLVSRPHELKVDLCEFTEPDNEEIDGVMPMKGHERVYYHTRNNQQMASLVEYDSEAEDDRSPDWLKEKTQDMIEEFTDVNEGEKMLMKMWNIHVLKKGYIADFIVANGCKSFVEEHGADIIKNNLLRNFLVHLNNMIEFQVIPQSALVQAMEQLYRLRETMKISD